MNILSMSSQCAAIAKHMPRLREAQRAFWLAWKALQAGDRSEFREAQRELEEARFQIMRLMDASWDSQRVVSVDTKRNYRLIERYEHPACEDNLWVELPDGKLLEYSHKRFSLYQRGHNGRYRAEAFFSEPNGVKSLHAIGNGQFLVGYHGTSPAVWHFDRRGHFVLEYVIGSLPLGLHIRSVGRLSDGRLYLTTNNRMEILAYRRNTGQWTKAMWTIFTSVHPTVHVNDVIVFEKLDRDRGQQMHLSKPDREGCISNMAVFPARPFALYEYQPDGRLMEFDLEQKTCRSYGYDGDGAYVESGTWRIERPTSALRPKRMTMLSFDRMLLINDECAEIWRLPSLRKEAIRETRAEFQWLNTDVYPFPDGRLVTVNEVIERRSDERTTTMMHIWSLDEHGHYQRAQAFKQAVNYTSVSLRPDGSMYVRTVGDELLVFDGDPVEKKV